MQLGMDGFFVGSGIFKSGEPAKRARAIVQAVTHYNDPKILAEVSQGLGEAMVGIDCKEMHFTSYALAPSKRRRWNRRAARRVGRSDAKMKKRGEEKSSVPRGTSRRSFDCYHTLT